MSNKARLNSTESTLLNSPNELLQTVNINEVQIVLSILDDLQLGASSDLADLSSYKGFALFCEQATLVGDLKLPSAKDTSSIISCNTINGTASPVFNAQGTDGKPCDPLINTSSDPGKTGGNGEPGGKISFLLSNSGIIQPGIKINVSGGSGAKGQDGTNTGSAGDGGNGGAGGKIKLLIRSTYLGIIDELKPIYALTNANNQRKQIRTILEKYSLDELKPLKSITNLSTHDDIQSSIETSGSYLKATDESWIQTFETGIDLRGGFYGIGGEGTNQTHNGENGADVTFNKIIFGSTTELSNSTKFQKEDFFFFAHPAQKRMLLEKAKMMYLVANVFTNKDNLKDLIITLERIISDTRIFAESPSKDIADFFKNNEAKYGALNSVTTFVSIHQEADTLLQQLRQGLDVFGNNPSYVPLASFSFYVGAAKTPLDYLSSVEANYEKCYGKLAKSYSAKQARNDALTHIYQTIEYNKEKLSLLSSDLEKTAGAVDSYGATIVHKKTTLDKKLKEFQIKIENHIDFNINDLLSGLSMCAFAPESKFNWFTQVASVGYKSLTEVTTDTGIKVQKSYLVGNIKKVTTTVDGLIESYQTTDNGTLQPSDPGAAKLLAEQSQFEQLFSDLSDRFGSISKEVETAFQNYVDAIISRNNQIIQYNAQLRLIVQYYQNNDNLQKQLTELNQKAVSGMVNDNPSLTSLMSHVYYDIRRKVMEELYHTSKSLKFLSLSDDNPISQIMDGNTPSQLNAATLKDIYVNIDAQYNTFLEKMGIPSTPFPKNPDQRGILFEVPMLALAAFVESGEGSNTYEMMVQVTPPGIGSSASSNVFKDMRDVRLSKVRLWLNGSFYSSTDKDARIHIDITHTGDEILQRRAPLNGITNVNCVHSSVVVPFSYYPAKKSNSDRIFVDGTLSEESKGTTKPLTYNRVGPFTFWHFKVRKDVAQNSKFDFSQVTSAQIEFHGTFYSPQSNSCFIHS